MAISSPNITASTTGSDQEKFLANKLISRSLLRLVAVSLCDKVKQPQGTGTTAYFVRYNRMNLPTSTLTEGTDPSQSNISVSSFQVTLDQWGDVIALSDIAQLTTKHPLVTQAMELLSENAQRVIDREIQIVWLANTNVQYADGSVTSRSTITASQKMSDSVIHKARVTLIDAGAPPREGPSGGVQVEGAKGNINAGQAYVAVCGPQVMADVMQAGTSLGTWASVAMYANQKALYNAELGTWLGVRWVETNFIPKFSLLGNVTAAVSSGSNIGVTGLTVTSATGGAGSLSNATYYFKVTRKDLTRGFEEAISIEHTQATGGGTATMTFAFPSTAGYVYNVYFGSSTGDANLFLAGSNIAASGSLAVTSVPASGSTAPANVNTTGTPTIHPVYFCAAEFCKWVGLQDLKFMVSGDTVTTDNALLLRKTMGYKFMHKALVPDSTRLLRVEVAASY